MIKFIDLFCGLGGFRIAFEKLGCECVFSSDIDEHVRQTYFNNFGEYPTGDIAKVHTNNIPDFDILCGGFPCQPFSSAGKRLGFNDTRGTLFFEVARILKEKQPKAFFLENVRGLTTHNNGNTLKTIMGVLDDIGYNATYKVINAKNCGYPQNRDRWYCVGFRKDLNVNVQHFNFPQSKPLFKTLSDIIQPLTTSDYQISQTAYNNIRKHISLKNITIDKTTLAFDIRPSRCHFATKGISPCLTAKMGTGGNNIPVVVSQNRKLTEQECLMIMGFPDSYKIGTGHQSYKQIGNSVVVPVILEIANEIINELKNININ
jgi:DNA (cytosine-5)-methyltransferase 1